jgi:hypothetical protein
MAGNYDNTNQGALFKNEKQNDRQPDYRGSLNVDGEEYWVSGWIKTAGPTSRNPGQKFMSLAVTPKEDSGSSSKPRADFDEDAPF